MNPFKHIIKMLFILIQQMGLRHMKVFFLQCLDTGSSVSATWPDYQRQLRRKPRLCQLSGSFSSRPASLRPLTASVGTCPTLSNISTVIHTHLHSRVLIYTETRGLICSSHAGGRAAFEELNHTPVCIHHFECYFLSKYFRIDCIRRLQLNEK